MSIVENDVMKTYHKYIEVLRQYDYPNGVTSTRPIWCTTEQARKDIGSVHEDNPAWYIEDMILREKENERSR